MPSCQACGRWFSEEDRGCGCDGERLSLTRKDLREIVARVLRRAAADESLRFGHFIEVEPLAMLADAYERWERKIPNAG